MVDDSAFDEPMAISLPKTKQVVGTVAEPSLHAPGSIWTETFCSPSIHGSFSVQRLFESGSSRLPTVSTVTMNSFSNDALIPGSFPIGPYCITVLELLSFSISLAMFSSSFLQIEADRPRNDADCSESFFAVL